MAKISFSDTPQFTDHCKHTRTGDVYHGSVCVNGDWHDVFSYDGGFEGRSACFRYGQEPCEYISPGGIEQAIVRHHEAMSCKTYGQAITAEQLAHHLAVYRECFRLIQPESFEGTRADGQE
jgi:hypothetical protein